tara:strand:- start:239 stop:457 length:219 start_codon:yes stop_codon:yes gene_type:complete
MGSAGWNRCFSGILILFRVSKGSDVEVHNLCVELWISRALNELVATLFRRMLVVLLLVLFVSLHISVDLKGG